MIGISACLAGVACRYDGKSQEQTALKKLVEAGHAIMVCPEVLGGLPIPRKPAEIIGGDGFDVWEGTAQIWECQGEEVTESYKAGARLAYKVLQEKKVTTLILKEKSPSCGSGMIYDGTFTGSKITGVGVATAYFINKGLKIFSEEQLIQEEGLLCALLSESERR